MSNVSVLANPDVEGRICALSRLAFATSVLGERVTEDLAVEAGLELETLLAQVERMNEAAQELREAFYIDHARQRVA